MSSLSRAEKKIGEIFRAWGKECEALRSGEGGTAEIIAERRKPSGKHCPGELEKDLRSAGVSCEPEGLRPSAFKLARTGGGANVGKSPHFTSGHYPGHYISEA
jgi:hypothetical protein